MPESNTSVPEKVYERYFANDSSSSTLVVTLEQDATLVTVTTDVIKRLEEKGTMKDFGE